MRQFLDLLKLHPVIAQWVELLLMAVATVIVLRLVLRLERKVTHRLLTHEHNINQRFVESAIRFGLILIAVIWVVMSSPITRPFGSIVFQGTAIIGGIVGGIAGFVLNRRRLGAFGAGKADTAQQAPERKEPATFADQKVEKLEKYYSDRP